MGSEGQLLPRDSALHSPPAAPGRPEALARKGAPGWPLGAGSSCCSCLDPSGPAGHLPRDWGAEVTARPPLEPSGTFVPGDAPLSSWDPLGSRSWEAPFPLESSAVLAPAHKSSRRITPHINRSPSSYQVARPGLRGQPYGALLPNGSRGTKFPSGEALAHPRTQPGSRGVNCQTDTPFTPVPEGPAHRQHSTPRPRPLGSPARLLGSPGQWVPTFPPPPASPSSLQPGPPSTLTPPLRRSPQLSKGPGSPTASTSSFFKAGLTQRCPTARGLLVYTLGTAQLPALIFRGWERLRETARRP